MTKKIARSSTWACIIYPGDSAPTNYLDIIHSFLLPVLVSPLHNPDKENEIMDPETGEFFETKKKHQHVMLYFSSLKSRQQVEEYTSKLNGTRPFIVHSAEGMIRYFIHWNNPEKEQFYNKEKEEKTVAIGKLLSFQGFEYLSAFSTYTDEDKIYSFIEDLITKEKIANMIDLLLYLKDHKQKYELKFVRTHTMYIRSLLDGMYHKLTNQVKKNTEAEIEYKAMKMIDV